LPNGKSDTTINFDPNQITPPCPISGSISYKSSLGVKYETKITRFDLIDVVTTLPKDNNKTEKNNTWYILIIAIIAIVAILVVFKVPKVRNFLSQKLSKMSSKENTEQKDKE
jgi:signal transduction histidine kinase